MHKTILFVFIFGFSFIQTEHISAQQLENNNLSQLKVQSHLKVLNAYSPKIPAISRSAAVYLQIVNDGNLAVELIDVKTSVARHAMIHQSVEQDGVAKMQHYSTISIPANSTLEFKPNSYHVMLMGLNQELMLEPFTLELFFKNHAPIDVTVNP